MQNDNIFKENTLKLKTKTIIFSGIALFIGLTEAIPTKLALIGLNFEKNSDILGWFLFIITIFIFLNFLLVAILDIRKYFQDSFLKKSINSITGDTMGYTLMEIESENNRM